MFDTKRRLLSLIGPLFTIFVVSSPASIYAQSRDRAQNEYLVGLYTFAGTPSELGHPAKMPENLPAFAKFCGYNTLEFCD